MAPTSTKPSKLRYKAISADVKRRAYYALFSGNRENPYEPEDGRYERFSKKLAHLTSVDSEFEDTCAMMGSDTSTWTRKVHQHPGPVLPVAELC